MDHLQTDHPEPEAVRRAVYQDPVVVGSPRQGIRYSDHLEVDPGNWYCVDLGNSHYGAGPRDIFHLDDLCNHPHCSLDI